MKPAGYENGQGILSAAYLKDPKDPQWKNDAAMNEWRAFMTKWYPEGDQEDAATVFGYGVAKGIVQVLRQCKDDLTRENIMKQAANLNFEIGIYLPGTKIKTSPTDFAPLEQIADDAVQGRELGTVRAADVGREVVGQSSLPAHRSIARSEATKQSILSRCGEHGLLRCARNDGGQSGQLYFVPSFAAGAASFAGGASAFFFNSSAVFFCRSSTNFCSAITVPFSASICRLAASSFC